MFEESHFPYSAVNRIRTCMDHSIIIFALRIRSNTASDGKKRKLTSDQYSSFSIFPYCFKNCDTSWAGYFAYMIP